MPRLPRSLYLLFLVPAILAARADEPPIIAKARAYLGSEDAISAVKSVHLQGTFIVGDPAAAAAAKTAPSTVDIIFQKPFQQHMVMNTKDGIRTVALDGYDGWERQQFPATNPNPRLSLLIPDQIRVLRADVWENLGYYRGLENEGGQVQDQGPATIDGVACEKIAFIHGWDLDGKPSPAYYRYFDQATGRLVLTETSGGLEIREEGELMVNGIRFPKIISSRKAGNPPSPDSTLTLEKVTINETFPASLFAVPLPSIAPAPAAEGAPAAIFAPGASAAPAAAPVPAAAH